MYINIHNVNNKLPISPIKNTHVRNYLPVGLSGIIRYNRNIIEAIPRMHKQNIYIYKYIGSKFSLLYIEIAFKISVNKNSQSKTPANIRLHFTE